MRVACVSRIHQQTIQLVSPCFSKKHQLTLLATLTVHTVRITKPLQTWGNRRFDRHNRTLVYFRWERNGGKSVQNGNQTFRRTPSSCEIISHYLHQGDREMNWSKEEQCPSGRESVLIVWCKSKTCYRVIFLKGEKWESWDWSLAFFVFSFPLFKMGWWQALPWCCVVSYCKWNSNRSVAAKTCPTAALLNRSVCSYIFPRFLSSLPRDVRQGLV